MAGLLSVTGGASAERRRHDQPQIEDEMGYKVGCFPDGTNSEQGPQVLSESAHESAQKKACGMEGRSALATTHGEPFGILLMAEAETRPPMAMGLQEVVGTYSPGGTAQRGMHYRGKRAGQLREAVAQSTLEPA